MLSIQLLGAPKVVAANEPIGLARRKSRALFYYLAAHTTPLTRAHLLAFFWPDAERQLAQQNLRSTLYGLRKSLGEWVQVEEDIVALAPTATVDLHRFTAQLSAPSGDVHALQRTLALYQGDFLDGFALPDLPEFDDWATRERERYQRLAITGYVRLSQLHEAEHAFRQALAALDQALAFDSLQEDLQRDALRLQYFAGDRAGAIRRFERLRELLNEEMGVPPMQETQALYDAIITDTLLPPTRHPDTASKYPDAVSTQQSPSPLLSPSGAPLKMVLVRQGVQPLPFVGRSQELADLIDHVTSHVLLLIEGEAGIGKSRLQEEFIHHWQQVDPRGLVLVGQARELETALPYQPWLEAVRTLLRHTQWSALAQQMALPPLWWAEVARLLPEVAPAAMRQTTTTGTVDELRLWEGISQFLLALAAQRPLLLAFEDLHWADTVTIGLLGYLLRKAAQQQAALTVVATARGVMPPTPLALLLEALTREQRLQRIALSRLTAAHIDQIAQQIAPYQARPLADWLTTLSEGNPFILYELLHYAREQELLQPDGTVALPPTEQVVPRTVYALILSRLARLSEMGRQLLNAATVLGREFEIEVVAHMVGLSDSAVLDSLDELQRAGLLQPLNGLRYRIDHHLTLEVAYQEMGEPRHRLFHRRAAEAFEHVYRSRIEHTAGRLVHHAVEGHLKFH